MMQPVHFVKITQNVLAFLSDCMSGRNWKGMRNRIVLATVLSVVAIAVDSYMVYKDYDYLPSFVATTFEWSGIALNLEHKSVFIDYEIERVIVLCLFLAVGYLIYRRDKTSIVRFRTFSLLAETANLVILTGVGVSCVMLALSMGDKSQSVSDYWEFTIMFFWLALSLVEYYFDLRFFKNQKAR